MTDKTREAFEAWFAPTFDDKPLWNPARNCYIRHSHHMAWKGWQAATEQGKRQPLTDAEFLDLILRTGSTEFVGLTTYVGGSIQMQGRIGLLHSAKLIKEFIEKAHGITATPPQGKI